MLIGEEQNTLPARKRPLQYFRGVRRGADDAAIAAAESLERCGRIHVRDWNDGSTSVRIRRVAVDLEQFLPAIGDCVDLGHVRHGAARRQVWQNYGLIGPGEHVRGFRHEMHAAEDDCLRGGPCLGGLRQLKRVAHKVGVLHDLISLIEVAENREPVAQRVLCGTDAQVELRR